MDETSRFSGRIPAQVALALLVSLRDVDTPADTEGLFESELPLNLRRRLGLSSVVVDQIRRYERRRGEGVSAAEVASLFELIGRRPDAPSIFREAGRRIAGEELDGRRGAGRVVLRALPTALRRRRAWRRVGRLARTLSPGSAIRVEGKTGALVVEGGLPAAAAESGAGCSVLEGTIERVFQAYGVGDVRVVHTSCETRAGGACTWELGTAEEPADPASSPEPGRPASDAAADAAAADATAADAAAADAAESGDAGRGLDPAPAHPGSGVG